MNGQIKAGLFSAVVAVAVAAAVALPGCAAVPSPAQQAADFANAEACVSQHWGEPVLQLAGECLAGSLPAAEDVVADIAALLITAGVALPDTYAKDPGVQSALARHKAKAGK